MWKPTRTQTSSKQSTRQCKKCFKDYVPNYKNRKTICNTCDLERICRNNGCDNIFVAKMAHHTTCPDCHQKYIVEQRQHRETERLRIEEASRVRHIEWEAQRVEDERIRLMKKVKKEERENIQNEVWNYSLSSSLNLDVSKEYALRVVWNIYDVNVRVKVVKCNADDTSDDETNASMYDSIYDGHSDTDDDNEETYQVVSIRVANFLPNQDVRNMSFINGIFKESDRLGSSGEISGSAVRATGYYKYLGDLEAGQFARIHRAFIVKKVFEDTAIILP